MLKKVKTFVNEKTFELMNEKAQRCNVSLPELARELLVAGVGA